MDSLGIVFAKCYTGVWWLWSKRQRDCVLIEDPYSMELTVFAITLRRDGIIGIRPWSEAFLHCFVRQLFWVIEAFITFFPLLSASQEITAFLRLGVWVLTVAPANLLTVPSHSECRNNSLFIKVSRKAFAQVTLINPLHLPDNSRASADRQCGASQTTAWQFGSRMNTQYPLLEVRISENYGALGHPNGYNSLCNLW